MIFSQMKLLSSSWLVPTEGLPVPYPTLILFHFSHSLPRLLLSAHADTPFQTSPSQLHSRPPPGQQLPLKNCTIGKKFIRYKTIYLPLHIHHIKTSYHLCPKYTMNSYSYTTLYYYWYNIILLRDREREREREQEREREKKEFFMK